MFNAPGLQQQIAKHVSLAALGGTIIWIALLVNAASKLQKVTSGTTTQDVGFGPLALVSMTKSAADNGAVTASFKFENDMLWYVLFWLAVGILAGYINWKNHQRKQS